MAAIRRQGGRNLQDTEVVVLEASGTFTVGQHDHIHELLERLQRIRGRDHPRSELRIRTLSRPTADIASGSRSRPTAASRYRKTPARQEYRWTLAMQTPVRSNVILTSTGHMHHSAERSPDAQLLSRFLFG